MRTICIVTTTRAEYGALKNLLTTIQADSDLELQIIATGTHLSPEFGLTSREIEGDYFTINKKIEMLLSSDTPVGVSKSMGLTQISFAEAFDELKPDILVVIGDRYELIPIVSAANIANIPVAHISGGEITEGSLDDMFRHAITKLSQLHFTAMDEYSHRIIQMGEHPSRVHTVGEIGLENILQMNLMSRPEFEISIDCKLKRHNIIFTFHPETTHDINGLEDDFTTILRSLDRLENTLLIFTKANADVGGRLINRLIDDYVSINKHKAIAFMSLGQLRYLSALKYVDAIVGNSSSGIIEAPSFNISTINIGDRQKGRVRASSIIDVEIDEDQIFNAIQSAFTLKINNELNKNFNPYYKKNSSQQIVTILKKVNLYELKAKCFYDISFNIKSI
ncbi:UDP-N-acetylglucosamine 2-epimerase [Aeromonas veronii]